MSHHVPLSYSQTAEMHVSMCLVRRRYDGDNTGNIDDKEMMQALHELGVLDPKVTFCLFLDQCQKA